jgi:flagella basal body P-ring formation protein FlgA
MRLFPLVCLGPTLSLAALAGCLPVSGDRILGRDLASIDARFAPLPASLTIGSAPVPGTRRVFAVAELTRLARAHGIELSDPVEACFEVPLAPIDAGEALREMRRALPGADIALVELSKSLVPAGSLEFPVTGLEAPAVAEPSIEPRIQLWRGYVRYTSTRKMPVWARVSVSRTLTAVVADRDLVANTPIPADALRIETRKGAVAVQDVATHLEDVVGRLPKLGLKAGVPIPLSVLMKAPDVRRGETVQVQVLCGTARLQLSAIAERDGHSGEMVDLRNPSSGKVFRAKLDGPRAVIVIGTGTGL